MPSLQIRDLPEDLHEAHRRLEILRELKERIETEKPLRLDPPPEDLVREDRER
jgi:hypothetical protein